jgi:hypothetical protein
MAVELVVIVTTMLKVQASFLQILDRKQGEITASNFVASLES